LGRFWYQKALQNEGLGIKIDPRIRKSGSYIGKKIIAIFIQIIFGFLLNFGVHGAPKN
jgi:hypothetical protein